jgi:two-component system, chemotaxis family, sensor kinase CheA
MNLSDYFIRDDSSPPFAGEGLDALIESFAALQDDTESTTKYLSIFIDEAEITLDQITDRLLALESGTDSDATEQLLIDAHRIKGSAASIGLHRAAKFAHLVEDALQEVVLARQSISSAVRSALLACADGLREYVQSLKNGLSKTEQFPQLAQKLLEAGKPLQEPPVQDAEKWIASFDQWRNALLSLIPQSDRENTYLGRISFEPGLPLAALKGRLIYEKLSHVGDILLFDPPAKQLEELESLDAVVFGVTTEKSAAEIRQASRVAGIAEFLLEPLLGEPQPDDAVRRVTAVETGAESSADLPADAPLAVEQGEIADVPPAAKRLDAPDAPPSIRPAETMRVEVRRLDGLMHLVGQLVTDKARFVQIAEQMKKTLSAAPHAAGFPSEGKILGRLRSTITDLGESIDRLGRVADGLQHGVMQTRMAPVGPLFHRFQRVVRDMIRTSGKDIRLLIRGEKTELDKRMIDELGDPLIHLIRNAADHGIELPEVRESAGKPQQGTITLAASHHGNRIFIQISDDGQGLDTERIRARAVAAGLLTDADAVGLTPDQCSALIWTQGLSTAEKVTEISGRGIGMDIVKAKIDELGGSVELHTTPGRGTTITLKLPLTLAILPSLLTAHGVDIYAVPLESVVEIVQLKPGNLSLVHQQRTVCLRGRVISVIGLNEVFGSRAESRESRVESRESGETFLPSTFDSRLSTLDSQPSDPELTLVIVGEPDHSLGLVVDRVLGEQDMVIQSLTANFRGVPGIAGAGILGDGRVSLILDVPAVLEMASRTLTGKRRPSVALMNH